MRQNSSERLAVELSSLLKRVHDYCTDHSEQGQPFGICIVTPRNTSVHMPTEDIQAELKRRATEYFQKASVVGYYLRYCTPPILSSLEDDGVQKSVTAEDYQLTFELPKFDEEWQQVTIARSLIYCPLDHEQHGWSEWFELQLEAIRLTPLLHQTLKELQIKEEIERKLAQPGAPAFTSFIYDYGINDTHFPEMSKSEKERWLAQSVRHLFTDFHLTALHATVVIYCSD